MMTVMETPDIILNRVPDRRIQNEQSPSVALLCAGLLRRGLVNELERVCNGFF